MIDVSSLADRVGRFRTGNAGIGCGTVINLAAIGTFLAFLPVLLGLFWAEISVVWWLIGSVILWLELSAPPAVLVVLTAFLVWKSVWDILFLAILVSLFLVLPFFGIVVGGVVGALWLGLAIVNIIVRLSRNRCRR